MHVLAEECARSYRDHKWNVGNTFHDTGEFPLLTRRVCQTRVLRIVLCVCGGPSPEDSTLAQQILGLSTVRGDFRLKRVLAGLLCSAMRDDSRLAALPDWIAPFAPIEGEGFRLDAQNGGLEVAPRFEGWRYKKEGRSAVS